MKKFIRKIGIGAVIGIFMLSSVAYAAEVDVESEVVGDFGTCGIVMQDFINEENIKFISFLERNFLNESADTSLMNIAVARYKEYKIALDTRLQELNPDNPNGGTSGEASLYLEELNSYYDCLEMTENAKTFIKGYMISHIKKNSSQKKTIIMVEKYQAINLKLRDLHFEIARMYALFETFKNKLPFFLSECLSQ